MPFHDDRARRGEGDKAVVQAHKAALEALFAPRAPLPPQDASPAPPAAVAKRESAKLVVAKKRVDVDPAREEEREKLVAKLLRAEGRAAVTRTANELARKGFPFPDDQEANLQLLDHADEARVRDALAALARLLVSEPPRRKAVLESRLARIEEGDFEAATRELAGAARRLLRR